MVNSEDLFKKIIGHCKEYGFIFQSSEIYDGLSAAYDYGQNGIELKNPWLICMRILWGLIPQFLCTQPHGKLQGILMHLMIR